MCWSIRVPCLDRDLELTGPIDAVLYASSSARDTGILPAKLVDVHPGTGRAIHIAEGILRARHRKSLIAVEFLEPGPNRDEFRIALAPTSNVFLEGTPVAR